MSVELKELIERRNRGVTACRDLLEKHAKDGKLPSDLQSQYDKTFKEEVTEVGIEIEQRNSYAERQKALDDAAAWNEQVVARDVSPETPEQRASAQTAGKKLSVATDDFGMIERRAANIEHRRLFERYLKRGVHEDQYRGAIPKLIPDSPEYRAILADTAGSGHDLLPPVEFIDQILIPRDRQVLIRKWATVRRLLKSTDGYQPTIETNPDDADWTTEVANVNEDTGLTTGKRELKPNVLTKLVKVSVKELMVLPQVSSLIADRLGYKFGVTEEKAFMTGNGTNKPIGVFHAAASGYGITTDQDIATGNTASAVTMDGLQNAKFALPPPYWPNAKWIFHPTMMLQIATLKDSLNRYLWQPNTQVGQPDMLLGFPAMLDVWAPSTVSAGAYVGILGDFSYYHIADLVEPFSVQRLNELYAGNNQVGFLGREYCDGMPVMSEAFVRVTLGESSSS